MTLAEHLLELRNRLLVAVGTLCVGAVLGWIFYGTTLAVLKHPYCAVNDGHCQLYITAPLDGITLRVKIAAFSGLVLASPVLLWEVWRFITPGLHAHERRWAIPFIASSLLLFLGGCGAAYLTLPHAIRWLDDIGGPSLKQIYDPNQYLSLIIWMMIIFGIAFEFPLLLVTLELLGVVTPAKLLAWWRWSVIGIVAAAAIFTPSSDPFSMMVLAVPLVAFYFLAILVGKLLGR